MDGLCPESPEAPTPGYSGTSREVLGAANYVHAVARGSEIVIELAAEDPDSCTS